MKITLHELMHTQGFAFLCNKGHYGNSHIKNTIAGGPEGGDKFSLGKMYDHGDETCPDLKDSVFLEPKSAKPFNPVDNAWSNYWMDAFNYTFTKFHQLQQIQR